MVVLIDSSAALARPEQAAIAAWAQNQRVFISSVMSDLQSERVGVAAAVAEYGATPVWFENFGGRDDDAEAAYLAEVRSCTLYIGILGRTYGKLGQSRRSATHQEYREAEKAGLNVSVWVRAGDDFEGDQLTLINEVRTFHTTGTFTTAEDLQAKVARVWPSWQPRMCRLGRSWVTRSSGLGTSSTTAKPSR